MGGVTLQTDSLKSVILMSDVDRRTSRNDSDLIALSWLYIRISGRGARMRHVSLRHRGRSFAKKKTQDEGASEVWVALNAKRLKRENCRRS